MYHIKPDKRSQASAKLIVDGLYQCLDKKKFSDISISDIQRVSGVGRSTFYRLFDNLADVLEYECDEAFKVVLTQYKKNVSCSTATQPFDALMTSFMEYWMTHSKLLNALLESRRIDILNAVYLAHSDEIGTILVPDWTLSEEERRYFVQVASAALFGVFSAWASEGQTKSSAELIKMLKSSINMIAQSIL